MNPIRLSKSNLGRLAGKAAVPSYDQAALSPGIVHFGVGNFHRAHQAVYLDDLFNTGKGRDWALVGAGVLASDRQMRELLLAQDCLTTVVEQEADRSEARVTAPMVDFLDPADSAAMLARLADPAIRIVSMTITEGGYFVDAEGRFDPAHRQIVADAASLSDPKTVFGFIVAGLKARRAAGTPAFTVMSCDNVPHNGIVARNAVVGLARLSDAGLASWIEENVSFPNGMVDRITPATSDRERHLLADEFGIEDRWPVFCEGFRQWVLEDDFPAGRPPLEEVGVQFVSDVTPYEVMKIRILNGGHAVIAYPAGLMDIYFVHEAMQDPLVRAFLEKVEGDEIIPVVPPVPDTGLEEYFEIIKRRFANPKIGDTVRRLCLDGSNRQPKFIVPSISANLEKGRGIEGLALESALWCRYCYGTSDSGAAIEPNDPNWDRLQVTARKAKEDPAAWLSMKDIYGEVAGSSIFAAAFGAALRSLWETGTRATLQAYLGP